MRSFRRVHALVGLAVLSAAVLLSFSVRSVDADLKRPRELQGVGYVGSSSCKQCHARNYASWHRTFHRSMTQAATDSTVLGDFNDRSFEYMGVRALMRRTARGQFSIEWSGRDGLERASAIVERTVGSRRFQQYLARDGDLYYRLPIAWNVEEQRFMHMNGAFLTPDPKPEQAGTAFERADYHRHVTRWNDNCVYCHNVAPNPGLDRKTGRFDTQVAELGIACEACHGPGARHVSRNHSPLRRFSLHLSGRTDPSITNPARLTSVRSAQVCGHCHGQRIAPDIERVHREGDRFVPGEDLATYSQPLFRDSIVNDQRDLFAARFWPDGTARLTAYEYQGLLQSRCAKQGALSCLSCHAMHDSDPRGQLRTDRKDNSACTACHAELAGGRALANHTHHEASSDGSLCVSCHMPRIVYGLQGVHRSHRIDSPRPELENEKSHPEACSLCHVDKSRAWAAAALRKWSGAGEQTDAASMPETSRLLLAGDPIERALAADALGRKEASAAHETLPARFGLLLDTLQTDAYPAVRAIAWRSLRTLIGRHHPQAMPAVSAFTPTDGVEARRHSLAAIAGRLPPGAVTVPEPAASALRALANDTRIFIGE